MALAALSLLLLLALSDASSVQEDHAKIVNGEYAKPGEIPYHVSLHVKSSSSYLCSGSILNENYVITAAACVYSKDPATLKVVAGTVDLSKPQSQYDVEKIIVHEGYGKTVFLINDIALVKVKQPFVQSDHVAFVPLPSPNEVVNANDVAVVSGWVTFKRDGHKNTHLQRVNISVADQEYCKSKYEGEKSRIDDSHICASDSFGEDGACTINSGAPLTVNGKLVGLVSWGELCSRTDYPTVFTRVSFYLKWINDNSV